MPNTVLYHDDTDGFCAAWVASKYLPDDTTYRAVNYGQDPPWEIIDGRKVYVLDFSYKRAAMEEIIRRAGRLVCLDHHKSADAELRGLDIGPGDRIEFAMHRAGCRMALDFFEALGLPDGEEWKADVFREKGNIVDYVQDRDLWKFELPNSRAINAAIRSFAQDFVEWDVMAEESMDFHYACGLSILRNEQRQVEIILRNARQVTLGGHRVWAVNTPILQSECAGELAEILIAVECPAPVLEVPFEPRNVKFTDEIKPPFGVAWFQKVDGKIVVSLRSRGEFDVSELARKFGGGGHKGAAGFETNMYADLFGPPDA